MGRPGRASAAPSLSSPCTIRPTSASRSGVGSRARVIPAPRSSLWSTVSAGRKSATAAAMTRASKPAAPAASWVEPQEGGAEVGRGLDPDDGRVGWRFDVDRRGHQGHPGASIERGLGDRDAHPARRAIADEPDRVDGLARAARRHHDVATLEIGIMSRLDERRARGRVGGPDRAIGHGRDHGLHDRPDLGEAAHAGLPGRQRTRRPGARSGSRSRRRRRATLVRVAGCVHMSPSIAGATTTGAEDARHVAVTTSPARPLAIAPSQCAVAGATTMASAVSATTMWPIRPSGRRASRSVSTGWRDSAANVSGPTNRAADGVSITAVSAPSARRARTSSTAL